MTRRSFGRRPRYWHATESYEGSWSGGQLHSKGTIALDHGNNDENIFVFSEVNSIVPTPKKAVLQMDAVEIIGCNLEILTVSKMISQWNNDEKPEQISTIISFSSLKF